jgi:hypothetical protein
VKFSLLRRQLEQAALAASRDGASTEALNALFTKLSRFDDLEFAEVIRMFETLKLPRRADVEALESARNLEQSVVADLRVAFDDDFAFRDALAKLQANKGITRDGLNRIYNELFSKQRSLASKATREKLVQDIADLRLTRVRSMRAAEYFSGKVAS